MRPADVLDSSVDVEFGAALQRARGEFLEMPGLRLTAAQAARLWALPPEMSVAVLTALVDARFLVRDATQSFRRSN